MAKIATVAGRVSHAVQTSETSGTASSGVSTTHSLAFRIENRPASYAGADSTYVANGDYVTAAGNGSGGVFEILAMRNESTNIIWKAGTAWKLYGWFAILLGIPTSFIVVGIPVLISGVLLIRKGYRNARANELLLGTPRFSPRS